MSVIFIVLPIAILMAAAAVGAFLWCVKQGQYDDVDTPAYRVIHEQESQDSGKK